MKLIPLSHGCFAKVDDEDFTFLSSFTWWVTKNKHIRYAATEVKGKTIRMHRMILGLSDPKIFTDHKNHDGLDNQRGNLRVCTPAQNAENSRKIRKQTSSWYRGVYWCKQGQLWRAQITVEKKHRTIGRYKTQEEAALAYNRAATEAFGEFAHLNQVSGGPTGEDRVSANMILACDRL